MRVELYSLFFLMKRILYTCFAALAAACAAPAAEDSTPAAGEATAPAAAAEKPADEDAAATAAEEEEPAETDVIASVNKKLQAIEKAFADLEKPNRTITQNYNRQVEDANERLKKMETLKGQIAELEAKLAASGTAEYTFSVVPDEDRYKYETEGNELAKRVIDSLNGKSEAVQIEGLRLFEVMRDTYQGLPQFKEAHSLYQKLVSKFEKKWSIQLDNIKRERQKWPSSRKDKVSEGEQLQFDNLVRKLESENLNIDEDWFAPKMSNSLMLDRALSRARRAKGSMQNKVAESGGKVPELLHRFWENMDAARDLMVAGKHDEAIDKVSNDDSYRDLTSMSRNILPEEVREGLRKQMEELRNEARRRQGEVRGLERDISRVVANLEREARYLETRMDHTLEALLVAKEDEVRRAEEAAAREAELKEEQEREAAEAAAEAAEAEEDEDETPKKTKKKKSKKKAQ